LSGHGFTGLCVIELSCYGMASYTIMYVSAKPQDWVNTTHTTSS
jgi:hypothetical protein